MGILIANLINYKTDKIHPWGWRLSLGLTTVPATLMFVGGLALPETPNSLAEQGKLEEHYHWHELDSVLCSCHVSDLGFQIWGITDILCLNKWNACRCYTRFDGFGGQIWSKSNFHQ
ncbi:hypothetical protein F3Y22_tig00110986pilonHSYRG00033 [Hibiscus syriacus]|uniref:Major facilitator superfamily (MFS) profile domain-containing protein n=1 Tax=Hibiscus syriacus TaxID=106335 RepID=A0A6A2ZAE7_HIBSY|nr:hypothetical protein F3Y22_tig00110986pilonHSYRG00033 [Hibiscus syriacus]